MGTDDEEEEEEDPTVEADVSVTEVNPARTYATAVTEPGKGDNNFFGIKASGIPIPIFRNEAATGRWRKMFSNAETMSCISIFRGFLTDAETKYFMELLSDPVMVATLQQLVREGGPLTPRHSGWFGFDTDENGVRCTCTYDYSGLSYNVNEPPPMLVELNTRINEELKSCSDGPSLSKPSNAMNVNYYMHGKHSLGYHGDREDLMKTTDDSTLVASLSLGATRSFHLKERKKNGQVVLKARLKDGDLMTMEGKIQKYYNHAIPRTFASVGARVNITCRWICHREGCPCYKAPEAPAQDPAGSSGGDPMQIDPTPLVAQVKREEGTPTEQVPAEADASIPPLPNTAEANVLAQIGKEGEKGDSKEGTMEQRVVKQAILDDNHGKITEGELSLDVRGLRELKPSDFEDDEKTNEGVVTCNIIHSALMYDLSNSFEEDEAAELLETRGRKILEEGYRFGRSSVDELFRIIGYDVGTSVGFRQGENNRMHSLENRRRQAQGALSDFNVFHGTQLQCLISAREEHVSPDKRHNTQILRILDSPKVVKGTIIDDAVKTLTVMRGYTEESFNVAWDRESERHPANVDRKTACEALKEKGFVPWEDFVRCWNTYNVLTIKMSMTLFSAIQYHDHAGMFHCIVETEDGDPVNPASIADLAKQNTQFVVMAVFCRGTKSDVFPDSSLASGLDSTGFRLTKEELIDLKYLFIGVKSGEVREIYERGYIVGDSERSGDWVNTVPCPIGNAFQVPAGIRNLDLVDETIVLDAELLALDGYPAWLIVLNGAITFVHPIRFKYIVAIYNIRTGLQRYLRSFKAVALDQDYPLFEMKGGITRVGRPDDMEGFLRDNGANWNLLTSQYVHTFLEDPDPSSWYMYMEMPKAPCLYCNFGLYFQTFLCPRCDGDIAIPEHFVLQRDETPTNTGREYTQSIMGYDMTCVPDWGVHSNGLDCWFP